VAYHHGILIKPKEKRRGQDGLLDNETDAETKGETKVKKKSASKVVALLGGPFRAAAALGTSPQAVCNWVRRDTIPPGRAADIIRAAKSAGHTLSFEELI
jgi:hypothetical protein